ncbi:MAG: amidohydrolase family protein [Eubacteriaceae bacterium]
MKTNGFILKGNIIYSKDKNTLMEMSHGFLICEDRKVVGVFKEVPEKYLSFQVTDYGDNLIIPGLVDLHVHAPQYTYRGLGMDLELLPWLQTYTFPEESKYGDEDYAHKAYDKFVRDLGNSATTRAGIFGTLHGSGTLILMDLLEKTGIQAYVGKVNMDRNSIESLAETAEESAEATIAWIEESVNRYENVKPILTPRFIPSCTDELMEKISTIQKEYKLPLQSHLSENLSEIAWVKELHPETTCYAGAYAKYDLFGGEVPTIMAHCTYPEEIELKMLEDQGVFIAHCPQSNTNICSGIAPVRTFLDRNMKVGLGSDIAGGGSLSIFRAMADAIQVSKLRWVLKDKGLAPLNAIEAFYLGTKGGGEFWGNVGSFEPGYEFDAVVIDDSNFETMEAYGSLVQRLERLIYLGEDHQIRAKYIQGKKVK